MFAVTCSSFLFKYLTKSFAIVPDVSPLFKPAQRPWLKGSNFISTYLIAFKNAFTFLSDIKSGAGHFLDQTMQHHNLPVD